MVVGFEITTSVVCVVSVTSEFIAFLTNCCTYNTTLDSKTTILLWEDKDNIARYIEY